MTVIFRIYFYLLMFACQVTQRPYPQLQQLQQCLKMCRNHSEATIAKPAWLWDSQIWTTHQRWQSCDWWKSCYYWETDECPLLPTLSNIWSLHSLGKWHQSQICDDKQTFAPTHAQSQSQRPQGAQAWRACSQPTNLQCQCFTQWPSLKPPLYDFESTGWLPWRWHWM